MTTEGAANANTTPPLLECAVGSTVSNTLKDHLYDNRALLYACLAGLSWPVASFPAVQVPRLHPWCGRWARLCMRCALAHFTVQILAARTTAPMRGSPASLSCTTEKHAR